MDTKDKDIRKEENELRREERERHIPDLEAQRVLAEGKERRRNGTKRTNKLWLWLGILILVFILLYWLFTIGIFDSLTGAANG